MLYNQALLTLAIYRQPVPSAGSVRVTGDESEHIFAALDLDRVDIVRLDDGDLLDVVGQLAPEVGDGDGIAGLKLVEMAEIVRAVPASVTGDNAVCVRAADGQTGLSQHRRAFGHIIAVCSEIQRHFEAKRRQGYYSYNTIFKAVVSQLQRSGLICFLAIQARLSLVVYAFVICPHIAKQLVIRRPVLLTCGLYGLGDVRQYLSLV